MPKLKTNKAAAKRFKVSANGKLKHQKQNKQHILTKKSPKRKRQLRKMGIVGSADEANIKRMLPYA